MTAIFSTSMSSMDIKHEMIYRDDDLLLVKSEPQLLSPCSTSANGLLTSSTLICSSTNGLVTSLAGSSNLNGLTSAISPNNNGLGLNSGPFSGLGINQNTNSQPPNKRPRTEEWLSSPSPGTISVSAPPLTPSPGPPTHTYAVISNGYPSPMSSGSYDPYSPTNGKLGE
ncbi:hypothetical protein HHI36_006954 [Cryptolaemus montrouzieri]|uniref:Ecdysone receptor n=1 Tax=Cryptolaemus montrouzieri TaxID=559131 RepID=A0ABD2MP10_9CUCU